MLAGNKPVYNNLDFFEFLLVGIGFGCLVAICSAYVWQRTEEHRQIREYEQMLLEIHASYFGYLYQT